MAAPIFDRLRPELAALSAYRVPKTPPAIKLDANEAPFSWSEAARASIAAAATSASLNRYPDGTAEALRGSIAEHLARVSDVRVPAEELLLGAGSDEDITMLMTALCREGDHVVFPSPTFVMYDVSARARGLRPLAVPLREDFAFDAAAFARALEEHDAPLAFYATPNNPTGVAIDDVTLRELIEAFPRTLHVIDEAYGPFDRNVNERHARTRLAWTERHANVAVMGTLSKIGLAGCRVGYLRAHLPMLLELEKVRQPFNLSTPAMAIAGALLDGHHEELQQHLDALVGERARVFDGLSERGLAPLPSRANFHLARLAAERADMLRAQGIGVRVFGDAALAGWARVTVGSAAENDALLAALG